MTQIHESKRTYKFVEHVSKFGRITQTYYGFNRNFKRPVQRIAVTSSEDGYEVWAVDHTVDPDDVRASLMDYLVRHESCGHLVGIFDRVT